MLKNLYPKEYYERIDKINLDKLIQKGIKGLLLDVDNTLIDKQKNMPKEIKIWVHNAKQKGIKMCIVSNSDKKQKVAMVARKLGMEYVYFAKKPLASGFIKGAKILGLKNTEIAAIGDQVFTDILGANRAGIYSILVKPISKEDILITRIKRPIENVVIRKYLKL